MFKLVKKLLTIIGVFKFTGVESDLDKDMITHAVLFLIGFAIGAFAVYVMLMILI